MTKPSKGAPGCCFIINSGMRVAEDVVSTRGTMTGHNQSDEWVSNAIEVKIGGSCVTLWPRNENNTPIVDFEFQCNQTVNFDISISADDAETLRDAITTAIDRSRKIICVSEPE
jgi:hypothetical protein